MQVVIITQGMKYGCLGFLGWCGYLSIASLAGKHTIADIVISFLGNITVSKGVAYIFGAGGTAYGVYQRKLRRDFIERHSARDRELELQHDPSRSSSHLTPRGETPKEIEK